MSNLAIALTVLMSQTQDLITQVDNTECGTACTHTLVSTIDGRHLSN